MFRCLSKSIFQLFLCFVFLSFCNTIIAQGDDAIIFNNPSFEGIAGAGTRGIPTVSGWFDCGRNNFPNETPPDLHPSPIPSSPFFGVTQKANHGNTYLGLVVRDNDTWESVSQRLSKPLRAGQCYRVSLFLARSENYTSPAGPRESNTPTNRDPNEKINHNTPTALRIWGGNGYCDQKELLASTSEITHSRWIEYTYKLEPTATISHITFEAFYKTPTPFPYNGNLLIDNVSSITPIPCKEEPPMIVFTNPERNNQTTSTASFTFRATATNVADQNNLTVIFNNQLVESGSYFDARTGGISVPQRLKKGKNTLVIRAKNSAGKAEERINVTFKEEIIAAVEPPSKPSDIPTAYEKESKLMKRSEIKAGKTVRIDKLYFPADSTTIKKESYPALNEVYDFLMENPKVVVEVGGHTNNVPPHEYCNKLSANRAKAVVTYLVEKGIDTSRLRYKGYGKTNPIATNKTMDGRRRNQRVEIKILSINS